MLTVATFSARADETIKNGPIAAFSGPFGDYCQQMQGGIKTCA